MVKKIIERGRKILTAPQSSIFSAASVIMVMVIAAKVLGFIRQRTLFAYFAPETTDLYLAAFELPDLVFEVFIYGVLSAAFIPVFSKYLTKKDLKEAWYVAANTLNILLTIFVVLAVFVFIFGRPIYSLMAGEVVKDALGIGGGFDSEQIDTIVSISRLLIFAQLFFVVSSFFTGVLESFRRFLIPAIAPLLYNVGIIFGTILLAPKIGLYGPALGAVFGALLHLLIQTPLAFHLGFKPIFSWDTKNKGVRRLGSLAAPRVVELAVLQTRRFVWLFLATLLAGGFTYLKSAQLIQSLALGVFGLSLAKAALPTLSNQAAKGDMKSYKNSFVATLNQIFFLVIPFSVLLAVLRIPVVRLAFGAQQFDWPATIQTSTALTAFVVGLFAYAGSLLVARAFYALQDTKTPVAISIFAVVINAVLSFVLVLGFGLGTAGIALSYSISGIVYFTFLLVILLRRINERFARVFVPFLKITTSSLASGLVMYLMLKIFDRSVWIKKLSFLSNLEASQYIPFESFVLDTRYTVNLLALTIVVALVGGVVYLIVAMLLRTKEVWTFFNLINRVYQKGKISTIPAEEKETVSPPPQDPPSS